MARRATLATTAILAASLVAASAGGGPAPGASPEQPSEKLVLALLNPERAEVVDLRSRRRARRRLPGGTLCYAPLAVSGGHLILPGLRRRGIVALALGLGLKGRARLVARGDMFLPSASEGRIWTVHFRSGRMLGSLSWLREVSVDGQTILVSHRQTPGSNVVDAADDGLIFERRGRLLVWDPRRGVVVRRLPGDFVLATHGHEVATCSSRNCTRLNVVGRGQKQAFTPGQELAEGGAFSPDGRLLAVPVRAGRRTRILVVDLDTRAVRAVPSARMGDYAPLTWSRSGQSLYFVGADGRLMSYRPGAASSKWLRMRFPDPVMQLATG
jgi:hypothetical protein